MEAGEEYQESSDVIAPAEGFAPDWPDDVRLLATRVLEQYDPEEVRGQARLGALSFNKAAVELEEIRRIIVEIAQEHWDELPPNLSSGGALQGQLQELCTVFDQMLELTSDSDNANARAGELNDRFNQLHVWFRQELRPHALNARIDRQVGRGPSGDGIGDVEPLRKEYSDLQSQLANLKQELDAAGDAVSATRKDAGTSAAQDLEGVFKERADEYSHTAKEWLKALIVAVPVSAIVALATFELLRPDSGSKDAHDFAGLGFWLFVLGLLAFGIRVCAQNYRVNRHLATIARSKQSSISTFRRLVASVAEEELRAAVTLTLVQSVFAVEETGLVDGSGDHVTLVERAVIPNLPKTG